MSNLLAVVGGNDSLSLWRVDGTPQKALDLFSHSILALCWSTDGKKLATLGKDKILRLFEQPREHPNEPTMARLVENVSR